MNLFLCKKFNSDFEMQYTCELEELRWVFYFVILTEYTSVNLGFFFVLFDLYP